MHTGSLPYKANPTLLDNLTRLRVSQIHTGLASLFAIAKAMQIECELFDTSYIEAEEIHKKFREKLIQFSPDILAITCVTPNWNKIKKLLKDELKDYYDKNPLVIVGGPHPTAIPETVISFPLIDIVVIGEGELAFSKILKRILANEDFDNIPGVWYKVKSQIIKNSPPQLVTNLDTLPYPDWDLFAQSHLIKGTLDSGPKVGVFNTSRGCPYSCTYCSTSLYRTLYEHEKVFHREKTPERIIDEIEEKYRRFQFSEIAFLDETFIVNLDRLKRIGKLYKRKINLPFIAMTRPETLTHESLSLLRDMGIKKLSIGIECGNEEYRKKMLNRKISNQDLIEKFKLIRYYNIKTQTTNMIGLPFETKDMVLETIELNKKLEPNRIDVYIFQPLPGTKMFDICVENNLFVVDDPYDLDFYFNKSIIKTEVPQDELRKLRSMFLNLL